MHRPEHFLSFSNVDRVEKPDAARDNVEERDDAFNWGVCLERELKPTAVISRTEQGDVGFIIGNGHVIAF